MIKRIYKPGKPRVTNMHELIFLVHCAVETGPDHSPDMIEIEAKDNKIIVELTGNYNENFVFGSFDNLMENEFSVDSETENLISIDKKLVIGGINAVFELKIPAHVIQYFKDGSW